MPNPWEKYAAAAPTPDSSGPWAKYGAPPPTAAEEPEGFWHSLGAQVAGMLEMSGPGNPISPEQAASMANTLFTAARQHANPINPETGLPIPITPEMRNLHAVAAMTAPFGGASIEKMLEQAEAGNVKGSLGTA